MQLEVVVVERVNHERPYFGLTRGFGSVVMVV